MRLSPAERLGEIAEFMHYVAKIWPEQRAGALASLAVRCANCLLSERHSSLVGGVCQECHAFLARAPTAAGTAVPSSLEPRLDELLREHQGKAAGWHDALVMFSGGKDSTLLLHTLRQRYPGLRLLTVMIDHGFTSPVAVANAQRVTGMLSDVDHCTLRPRQGLYETTFRHTLTHVTGEGTYASVERLAGDLGMDICRNLAASRGIPLLIHGGTREQVERNLGVVGFETSSASERCRREQVNRFVLAEIYSSQELAYWWDGTRWPEAQIPRVIFPFCAWPYDEGLIRREVLRHGYFQPGHEDPIASNSELLPINLALDIQRLGFTSYEPDFARLVREGRAERTSLMYLFQAIEHLAGRGAFLPLCIADTLGRLQLTHSQLGLPAPRGKASLNDGAFPSTS